MPDMTSAQLNELHFRQMVEGSGAGKNMRFHSFASPECVYYGSAYKEPIRGAEALAATVASWRAAFPDLKTRVIDVIASDDILMARVMASGTHRGEMLGHPATGRFAEWELRVWARFENGLMVEDRTVFDRMAFLEQLGVIAS